MYAGPLENKFSERRHIIRAWFDGLEGRWHLSKTSQHGGDFNPGQRDHTSQPRTRAGLAIVVFVHDIFRRSLGGGRCEQRVDSILWLVIHDLLRSQQLLRCRRVHEGGESLERLTVFKIADDPIDKIRIALHQPGIAVGRLDRGLFDGGDRTGRPVPTASEKILCLFLALAELFSIDGFFILLDVVETPILQGPDILVSSVIIGNLAGISHQRGIGGRRSFHRH